VSTIADALRKDKEIVFLVELEFDGLTERVATKQVSVPNAGGDSLLFDGRVANIGQCGSRFDLRSFRYALGSVPVQLLNRNRFQDNEALRRLDGGKCRVFVWSDSLDWTDIENYPIHQGIFRISESGHNKYHYNFTIDDYSVSRFKTLPLSTINANTWPNHRTAGGGGSVAGKAQAILFGEWAGGVRLLCVSTTTYKYMACIGMTESADADFTSTIENVYDKNGNVIAAANYTFHPGGVDADGNMIAYFEFTSNQSSNEPLSCSIRALTDGAGQYTGSPRDLIEHPAHVVHYIFDQFGLNSDEINIEMIKTAKNLLPGMKFAVAINARCDGKDVVDRILKQCQAARLQRWGKTGIMVFHLGAIETSRPRQVDFVGKTVSVSKTPLDLICNNLLVNYGLNLSTGEWEGQYVYDRTNSEDCKKSYLQYGEQPQQELWLPDVQVEPTARVCAHRHLSMFSFQHDLVSTEVPYWKGWDAVEGDRGLLTVEEGASRDGAGWVDEPCILIEKLFKKNTILQTWWKIAA